MMKEEMKAEKLGIVERTVSFALKIIQLYRQIEKDGVGRVLGKQLLSSGTSVGANVHEAQGGQSRADFISKMSVAYKEARETAFWLRLLCEEELGSQELVLELVDETDQITKILSSILISSKQNG